MKCITTILLALALTASLCRADPSWPELQDQIGKMLGSEWTVAKDAHSLVAVRRNAKLLNQVSQIDPILGGADPWTNATTSDYTISITLRPRLTDVEYRELGQLKFRFIAMRMKGLASDTKEALEQRRQAEASVVLPDFFFGNHAVYLHCTDEGFFQVRPSSITTTRDEIVKLLASKCGKYTKVNEPITAGEENGSQH